MTPQDELLELIVDTVEKNCGLDSGISLEELPAESGLYAELGDGFTESVFYDKGTVKTIPVLFYAGIPISAGDWRNCVR